MASMAVVALFQGGLLKHLSDSPLSIASHAVSLAAATVGEEDRAQKHPWLPLAHIAVLGFTFWESKQALERLTRA